MLPGKIKVSLIGAGNVATLLGIALQNHGFLLHQVYSHTIASASTLGKQLQVPYTCSVAKTFPDADLYIFAVKDDALPALLESFPANSGLWIHTAGSVTLDIFKNHTNRYGVLYPLQTFSKGREVSFNHLPFFIEANSKTDEDFLCQLAGKLSDNITVISSEKRKYIHLAAAFASNFSNHMYTLASSILKEQQLDWQILLPLIEETVAKIKTMNPEKAQTGPAIRYDQQIINKHLDLLSTDKNKQEIYKIISRSIHKNSIFED